MSSVTAKRRRLAQYGLLLVLCLRKTQCFASNNPTASISLLISPVSLLAASPQSLDNPGDDHDADLPEGRPLRIVSVKKNGGQTQVFELWSTAARDERGGTSGSSGQQNGTISDREKSATMKESVVVRFRKQIAVALRSTFLPTGFPSSTPPGYMQYCVWSWIQDLSTQLRSVLATQRILEGVGVGREGATALSALFNYLVRDGCGMAASLLFTYATSSRFRTDVKRWRIFADIMVDLGITLECTATLFPRSFFLPMISLGNVCKALCGVAAGASGGSINLHWAKGSDISDINAKFGAQLTLTGALGLVFAGLFAQSVSRVSPTSLWVLYTTLTVLHIIANLRCMKLISFDYLNTARMIMVLQEFFKPMGDTAKFSSKTLPSPREVAKHEPLWFGISSLRRAVHPRSRTVPIHFGVAFDKYCELSGKPLTLLRSDIEELQACGIKPFKSRPSARFSDGYLITSGYNARRPKAETCVVVSFIADVTPLQQAKAYFHASLLGKELLSRIEHGQGHSSGAIDIETRLDVESQTQLLVDVSWDDFLTRSTHAGWDLNRSELQTCGFEIQDVQ